MKISSFIISSLVLGLATTTHAKEKLSLDDLKDIAGNHSIIYGEDDRYNLFDYENTIVQKQAKSVAMSVNKKRLIQDREDPTKTYAPHLLLENRIGALCSDEQFAQEVTIGNCSGFLVTPNVILTAAHCIKDQRDCENNKWIFNFNTSTSELATKDIYSCKKLIVSKRETVKTKLNPDVPTSIKDYALIELDRKVEGYEPLKLRKYGLVKKNTPLYVIGHPLGLSTKVIDRAKVLKMADKEKKHLVESLLLRRNFFTANIDSYEGNSGAPVFNVKTGKVEGFIMSGYKDFSYNYNRDCQESNRLPDNHNVSGERVMRITKIPELQELLKNQED